MNLQASILSANTWQNLAEEHRLKVKEFTNAYRDRRSRGKSHPIMDFLFTYYSFSIGRLETWHPSLGTEMESTDQLPEAFLSQHYTHNANTFKLDKTNLTSDRKSSIQWMIQLLESTRDRPPIFGCFGMHEWAMVYKGIDVRHKNTAPLRLSQEETDAFVESRPIQCSHFDAFRFFTKSAQPFNKLQPNKNSRDKFEQAGCVHANMDLYKWAYKCMPWVGSDFLWETFLLALELRELDMRAAPYDLSEFSCIPIKVETPEGRKEYEREQHRLAEKAAPLRQRLINTLTSLCA